MRDFPVFTTENGVASLILREIPYRKCAYIKLLSTLEPEKLLEECRDFCRAVGAERIYASGDPCLEGFPLHAIINEMILKKMSLPQTTAQLVPVTAQTLIQWKDIYNSKMKDVPNAAYMDDLAAKTMLKDGSGYFVELDGVQIGIGKVSDDTIEAVASLRPGAGRDSVLALCKVLKGEHIRLEVADSNTRAIALYERMGFTKNREVSTWHQIL